MENSGGWKTYRKFGEKPLPKNFFGPPTYDTFPPPLFGYSLSFPLKERGTDQTNPNFWGLQKWFWRAYSAVHFPPPQIYAIRFAPPSAAAQFFKQIIKKRIRHSSSIHPYLCSSECRGECVKFLAEWIRTPCRSCFNKWVEPPTTSETSEFESRDVELLELP